MSETTAPIQAPTAETPEQALTRAQAAAQAKRLHEATGITRDVLATHPNHPAATALSGIFANMMGDPATALTLLRQAIALQPAVAAWHAHLSAICRMGNLPEEALRAGEESIRLDPNSVENLVNLSLICTDAEDRSRAIACLLRAIGLKHDHADAHLALAQNLLAQGDFAAGLIEYEWRNLTEAGKNTVPAMTSAPWNGMPIAGGKLLLIGDQGYGDTLQFARFIPEAVRRMDEVIIGCSAEMEPLLGNFPGVKQYCYRWADVPGHAVHARLSSLPYLFGVRLDTIPAAIPYLHAPPARVEAWGQRFAASLPTGVRRVGLAWGGRPTHPNDKRRSIPLARLAGLAEAGPVAFVSLQKPVSEADRADFQRFPAMADISAELTDFGETAAVIANLDLVITVDTAMGHLAGAMGKPVWILLPQAADWRWLIGRDTSPWYPSARLFRQTRPGDWDAPLSRARAALARVLGDPGGFG
jgi:Flp pilus assembly protein TadD